MPGYEEERADVTIEPSARPIARLTPFLTGGWLDAFGVLRPFAGLLATRPDRPFAPPGPRLSYLTLQPLVVEYLRERTRHETRTETVERIERSAGREPSPEADSAPESVDTMTVREYIQRRGAEDDGNASGTGLAPAGIDPGERLRSLRDPRPAFAGESGGGVEDVESDPTVVARRIDEGGWQPPDGRPVGRDPDRDEPRPQASFEATAPTRADGTAMTSLDVATPSRVLERERVARTEAGGSRYGTSARAAGTGPAASPGTPLGGAGPALTLAEHPVSTVPAGGAGRSTETPLSVASPRRPDRDAAAGEAGGRRSGRQAESDRTGPQTGTESMIPRAQPPGRTDRDGGGFTGDPLSALDELDRPDLDRFVERLTDELARHERIERERRGR